MDLGEIKGLGSKETGLGKMNGVRVFYYVASPGDVWFSHDA